MTNIIPRSIWGAQYGTGPAGPAQRSRLIVHHFYKPDVGVVSASEEHRILRNVEDYHARTFWTSTTRYRARIAYNLIPFDAGRVYEGCGLTTVGAHTSGHNTEAFGLAFPINGDQREPTEAAWDAAAQAILQLQNDGILSRDLSIEGHRDHSSKSCPGGHVYPKRHRLLEAPMDEVTQPSWIPDALLDRLIAARVILERPKREPYVVWRLYVFLDRTLTAAGTSGGGLSRAEADGLYAGKGHGHTATTTIK